MANYYLDDDGKLITDPKKKKGKHYIMQPDGTFMLEEEEEIAPVLSTSGLGNCQVKTGFPSTIVQPFDSV